MFVSITNICRANLISLYPKLSASFEKKFQIPLDPDQDAPDEGFFPQGVSLCDAILRGIKQNSKNSSFEAILNKLVVLGCFDNGQDMSKESQIFAEEFLSHF